MAMTGATGGDVNYRFNNGIPNQITQYATPYTNRTKMNADLGIYAQDQWVLGQLTLNLGLRFDYFNGSVPASDTPATPSGWIPRRTFDEVKDVPSWKDLNPARRRGLRPLRQRPDGAEGLARPLRRRRRASISRTPTTRSRRR